MASFDLPIITVLAIAGKIVCVRYSRLGTVIIGTRVLHVFYTLYSRLYSGHTIGEFAGSSSVAPSLPVQESAQRLFAPVPPNRSILWLTDAKGAESLSYLINIQNYYALNFAGRNVTFIFVSFNASE